ncbi:MAG: glycosyltransferase family 2 protein [Candidatus Eisenbacteria bacterium]|uniref:Glycosyltransferase family 2 protein n=1 Tax=Eiseniibacteriota bacterium TaxID=2212470 RepID=A0A956LXA3_UNCEI|nr:glycosyltransferase family 2 protein [Candidatus Eisenbacteria bacterium]
MQSGVLVIIPAFHEAESLPALLPRIAAALPDADVLVIDDGSRDSTSAVARAGGARVARHPINLGYGAAIQTGYRYATRHGYRAVLQIDADGQHDPASLGDLLRTLDEGWDLVLGSRFLSGARSYRAPWVRRLGMRFFGAVSSAVLGRRITDPTTGFQALGASLVRYYAEGRFFPPDYPDADVLIRVGKAGFRVTEIPVTMYEKDGPSMHSGLRPIYYVMKMVLSILLVLTLSPPARLREKG